MMLSLPTADRLLFLVVVAAAASSSFTGADADVVACAPKERDALLAFKQGITSDPWGLLSSWKPEQDCSQWGGVRCSNLTGNVLELQLSSAAAMGNHMTSEIGQSLLPLQHLEFLDLSSNSLQGPTMEFLGSFKNLRYLDLSFSNLSMNSTTMPNLKSLCNLTVLLLDGCFSYGNITELIERLPQCSSNKLQELHLNSNHLVGFLPNFMKHLTGLVTLDLSDNNITGPLPAFTHFKNLRTLDLRLNALDGVITEEQLSGLKSLKHLYLSDNQQLKIAVDSKWIPTFKLEEAYLASCQIGPLFPAWLKWQVDLLRLDISSTGITDSLPDWFCNTFSKVTFLDMSNNQISGVLPTNMDIMSLESLYSSSNKLTGQIPQLPRNLSLLEISKNSLSGPLPSNFGAPKLEWILLYSNNMSGQIPISICELSLYALDLANNQFEGELPICINMTKMGYLLLSNNSFSGQFPAFLQSCTSLSFLDISHNRFSGTLPMWIGGCSSLQFLRLNHNMFYGNIPSNISTLTNLYHLNLASNWISGVIPPQLSNLTFMTRRYTLPGGTVPAGFQNAIGELLIDTKRQQLNYHGAVVLEILSIDLSSNYLSGKIPEGISLLAGLINLNLSRNQLSGEIPGKIGALQWLESLDLSNNNLSGEIPSSLSNLTHLSIFDLSNNNLTGRIPSGRQLDTLYLDNPLMYDGNIGLCGPPLQRDCSRKNIWSHGNEKEHHSDPIMFLHSGLGVGYVAGLWVVFCALLFQKAWRIAYFLLLDKSYDRIYDFVVETSEKITRKPEIN